MPFNWCQWKVEAATWSGQHQLLWKGCLECGLGKDVAESVAFLISTGLVTGFSRNINPALRLFCEADPLWKPWMTGLMLFLHLPGVHPRTNITGMSASILKYCFPEIPLKFYLIKEEQKETLFWPA